VKLNAATGGLEGWPIPNREFVENFSNSSLARPSGGAKNSNCRKTQKVQKGFVETYSCLKV